MLFFYGYFPELDIGLSRAAGIREKRGRREQVFVAAPNNEQDIGPSRKEEEGRSTVASSKPNSVW